MQGPKVRVFLTENKAREHRRTKARTPDLKGDFEHPNQLNILTSEIAKDNKTDSTCLRSTLANSSSSCAKLVDDVTTDTACPRSTLANSSSGCAKRADDVITILTDAGKTSTTDTLASSHEIYPTDARLRQKAREAEIKAGGDQPKDTSKIVRKRKKDIENHRDDCGNDLNSLLPFIGDELEVTLSTYLNSIFTEIPAWHICKDSQSFETTDFENFTHYLLDVNPLFIFNGTASLEKFRHKGVVQLNVERMLAVLAAQPGELDLCELCGGEARTSKLAIRRKMKVGENFDIV